MSDEPTPPPSEGPTEPVLDQEDGFEARLLARLYAGELVPATIFTLLGEDQDLSDLP